MKKLIGIPGGLMSQTNKIDGYGLNAAYVEYFSKFGDVIILDSRSQRIFDLDLLVLPGGADVDTMRYGQAPSIFTGRPNPFLEYFDVMVLPKYIQACKEGKLAIWGTCRGSQTLAVHFGIPLVQHIEQQYSSERYECVDKVRLIPSTQPEELISRIPRDWYGNMGKKNLLEINSLHHQGYMMEDFAKQDELVVLAYNDMAQSDGRKNVEFFRHREFKIAAGQHHSEECYDPYSTMLINWLLSN